MKRKSTPFVEDIQGHTWQVLETLPTEHGFPIFKGRRGILFNKTQWLPESQSGVARVVPTKSLIDHIGRFPTPNQARLPISPNTFMRLINAYIQKPTVKDVKGYVWNVNREVTTSHGFSVYFGHRQETSLEDKRITNKLIPTKPLAAYVTRWLNKGASIKEIDLPIETYSLLNLIEQIGGKLKVFRVIKDVNGATWRIYTKQKTAAGVEIITGLPADQEGVKAKSIVLTPALARYLKQHPALGQIDLPLSKRTIQKLRVRLGIWQNDYPTKRKRRKT